MSNDYDVATKLKPEQSVVDEFVCSRKELSVEGKLGVGDGNVEQWVKTLELAKKLGAKTICPGHGPIGTGEVSI